MSFVKNSFYTLVSNIIIIGIGFVTSVIISRTLGDQLQGVYNLAIFMPTMMYNFLNLGQDTSVMYYLSNKTISKREAIDNMLPVLIVYTFVATLIGMLSIVLLKERMFNDVPYPTLMLALAISPLTYLNNNLSAVLKSKGKFKVLNRIQVINKLVYFVICTILFLLVSVNIVILANIIILVISIVTIWRKLEIRSIKFRFNIEYQKNNFSYGLKSYLANMITFLNYRLDTFLIKALNKSTASVGQYGVAVTLAELVWVFSSAVSSVMFPYVTSIESDEEKSKVTSTTFKIVMVFTSFAIIGLLLGSNLIGVIYGPRYYGSIAPFRMLLLGIFSLSLGKILANDIAARGKPELNAFSNFIGLITNVLLNIILIPRLGIVGAAVATSISYTLTSIMFICSFLKLTGLSLKQLFIFNKEEIKIVVEFIKKTLKIRKRR